jgi:hypothetical protein
MGILSEGLAFVQDEKHRVLLTWIGGGIAAVAGAIWTVLKFALSKKSSKKTTTPTVSATNGGVAAGRDMSNNVIRVDNSRGKHHS